ncbi:MAG: hypothetical protein KBA26_09280 [Candidatus Delongbacteria bacterium]|nr:hypothetical protein [Candidatus Delongbacteria bacterium]
MTKLLQIISLMLVLGLATLWADTTPKTDTGCSKAKTECGKIDQAKCQAGDPTHQCVGQATHKCSPDLKKACCDGKMNMNKDHKCNPADKSGCCKDAALKAPEKCGEKKTGCEGSAKPCK